MGEVNWMVYVVLERYAGRCVEVCGVGEINR